MLNIVICENDTFQADELHKTLVESLKKDGIEYSIEKYYSGEELLDNYDKDIDIIFLDIQMGKLNGMDAARKIRKIDKKVKIIFLTSVSGYVYDAFEVGAYRFILKPFIEEEVIRHLNNCIKEFIFKNKKLSISFKGEHSYIDSGDIYYAEVIRKKITIYTEDKSFTVEMPIKHLEKELCMYNFFRCHNGFLINMYKVTGFIGYNIQVGPYNVPLSRYKVKIFREKILKITSELV